MASKPKTIAEQIRAAIRKAERRGVTRYQLAKLSGVSESALCKIHHGQRVPTVESVERIAAALGGRLTLDFPDGDTRQRESSAVE